MLFLLPLIIVASANFCPYCKWGSCQTTEGGLATCSSCYDLAALIPTNVRGTTKLGVCQLCPSHCSKCEFGILQPPNSPAILSNNCTQCHPRYINNYMNGGCDACPANCQICSCSQRCRVFTCMTCDGGYSVNATGGCTANNRRLQQDTNLIQTMKNQDIEEGQTGKETQETVS